MIAGWESAPIGDICDVVNGGTPKTGVPEYWGGPHRWITPAEMGKRSTPYIDQTDRTITDQGLQNSSARPLPPYSVILSSRAPIGHLVINTEPMATNQGCKGLVPRSQIDHKFLYYYLGSIVDLLNELGTGTTFKELSGGKLKEVKVPVPPIAEQRRIVAILDEAFEGIATAKANAEKNLQNAREVFRIRLRSIFDAVNGLPLPEGWYETQIKELGIVQSGAGFPLAAQGLVDGGIPFYKVSDMNIPGNEREMLYENNSITEAARRTLGASLFPSGSVIFPKIGGAIATNKKRIATRDCCVDNNVMGVVPRVGRVNPEFLFYFFLGHDLSEFANEAHLPSIRKTVVEDWKVSVPRSLDEQRRIASELEVLEDQVQLLERVYVAKLTALDDLKKSLLHQAFAGVL